MPRVPRPSRDAGVPARDAAPPRAAALLAALALSFAAHPARAQDAFEIQVYESDTAPALDTGLELHANYVGEEGAGTEPATPTDRGFHLTFEPHLGLTDWAEVGAYLQTAVRPDASYEYAGAKLRLKVRHPDRFGGVVGVAVNAELSSVPSAYSEIRWGTELRPIVDARLGLVYLSVNPILAVDLEGALSGRVQLEPAAKAEVMLLRERLGLGAEYYAGLGPIDDPLPGSEQVHRLFGVLDLPDVALGPVRLDVNVGVGRDLAAGDLWIVKSIVGIERD